MEARLARSASEIGPKVNGGACASIDPKVNGGACAPPRGAAPA